MMPIGKLGDNHGFSRIEEITIYGEPTAMPELTADQEVICGIEEHGEEGQMLYALDLLSEMQDLYQRYRDGKIRSLTWYIGTTPHQVFPERPLPDHQRGGKPS